MVVLSIENADYPTCMVLRVNRDNDTATEVFVDVLITYPHID